MAFVRRDATGQIMAVSREHSADFHELVSDEDPEFHAFLTAVGQRSALAQSDLEFIRVLDDLLAVLLEKNLLLFTELPDAAQAKISERNRLRHRSDGALDLLDGESLI